MQSTMGSQYMKLSVAVKATSKQVPIQFRASSRKNGDDRSYGSVAAVLFIFTGR